jgi:hypothetical protein
MSLVSSVNSLIGSNGTAKLTSSGRQSQHEYLQAPPIPSWHYQLRRLALLSFQPQSSPVCWTISRMLSMMILSMPTIGQSNRMSRPGCENEGCVVRHPGNLNRSGRLRDFWVYMQLYLIYSIWVDIWSEPSTIETSGKVRLKNGAGRWLGSSRS